MSPSSSRSRRRRDPRSTAEWVSFGVSTALVAAIVVAIVYVWINQSGPPDIVIDDVAAPRTVESRHYVDVTIANHGDETAEDVIVRAELAIDGAPPIEAEQVVDFLSGGETATVVFAYDRDPRQGQLDLSVAGYRMP